jgi:hypothetical protein
MIIASDIKSAQQATIFDPSPSNSLHPQADQIAAMIEAGELYGSDGNIRHDKQDYDKWPKKKKIKYCSRRVNNFGLRKLIRGPVKRIPRYCNHCDLCYEAKALQLKAKVGAIARRAATNNPDGQWRKKVVKPGKKADSLKKRIKRNQGERHIQIACTDGSGNVEIWSYVESEAGRDMDKIYGFEASLDGIDFDALYRTNRATGKKLSTGGAFRSSPGPKDEDTERMTLPDIIIKDTDRLDEAEQIISDVNFIKEAETSEEVKRLYAYQFGLVLKALEEARIEIAAIKIWQSKMRLTSGI